jgi:nucleoside-diphosphate-sugar epimerase
MVLLTGSSGFLGNIIENYFIDNSINYKVLNSTKGDFKINLRTQIPQFETHFETVIHCAGLAHFFPKSDIDNELFIQTNINGTINLLKGLDSDLNLKNFVFISSVSVYGIQSGELIDETYPLLAKDPYGISKIKAEKIIQDWCLIKNINCTILRLPLIVSTNPKGNLGTMIKAIRSGYYFNIGNGSAKKSMVLAEDVAKIIIKVSKIGGTYNLTDGRHPNFIQISKLISENLGKNYIMSIPYFIAKYLAKIGDIFGNRFPINTNKFLKITSTLTFDDTKARNTFDWEPQSVLENFKFKNN